MILVLFKVVLKLHLCIMRLLKEEKHQKHAQILEPYQLKAEYYICSWLNKAQHTNPMDSIEKEIKGSSGVIAEKIDEKVSIEAMDLPSMFSIKKNSSAIILFLEIHMLNYYGPKDLYAS